MLRLSLALATCVALLNPLPAVAGSCKEDIAKIDVALAKTKLDADKQQEVIDLREQAVQLCGAGNEAMGLEQTAQAKQILHIE